MRDFKLLDREDIYSGRIIELSIETVLLPGGREAKREVVRHPGSVAIVPLISPDEVILIKQFRYCAGKALWEIPAGTLEADETPIECAGRELIEETGYSAGTLEPMGGFFTAPGFCTEFLHLFTATDLKPCASELDDDEQLTVHKVSLEEALRKISSGEIIDAKTMVGLLGLGRMRPEICGA